MKLRPIKYEFLAQRKEALESAIENFPASLRSDLEQKLMLRRPSKAYENTIKTIYGVFNDHGTKQRAKR